MTIADLKKSLLDLMKTIYPTDKYKYYAKQVVEKYERPAFFTQVKPIDLNEANYNTFNNHVMFYITYMQKAEDEFDMMKKVEEIRKLFGLSVKVKDRYVKMGNFDYDFVGRERNILEISVECSWLSEIEHSHNEPLIDTIEVNYEYGGN